MNASKFPRHSKMISSSDSVPNNLSYLLTAVVSLGNTVAEASSSLTVKQTEFSLPTLYYPSPTKVNAKTYVFF